MVINWQGELKFTTVDDFYIKWRNDSKQSGTFCFEFMGCNLENFKVSFWVMLMSGDISFLLFTYVAAVLNVIQRL